MPFPPAGSQPEGFGVWAEAQGRLAGKLAVPAHHLTHNSSYDSIPGTFDSPESCMCGKLHVYIGNSQTDREAS